MYFSMCCALSACLPFQRRTTSFGESSRKRCRRKERRQGDGNTWRAEDRAMAIRKEGRTLKKEREK
jgi:hypothetical protein